MVPLQIIGDPSAVRRQTLLEEDDFGPGNTETEAPELTRNSLMEQEGITAHLGVRLRFRLRECVKETGRLEGIHLRDC